MASGFGDDAAEQHARRLFDIEENPCRKLMPIQGYENMPLVSLEEAIEPLVDIVHDVKKQAAWAKWKCTDPPADKLSIDESASIILYSMEWEPRTSCLYYVLNSTLRNEDRQKLKPWFLYLKLLLTSLSRLPPVKRTVYRGIKGDLRKDYKEGQKVIWWGFSSCTRTLGVLNNEQFLGMTNERTLFAIECNDGKDIRQHSAFEKEDEVLLPAARCFQVTSSLLQGKDLFMVQLSEIEPPVPLINLPQPSTSASSMGALKIKNHKAISPTATWSKNGITVAGGNGLGDKVNQLHGPCGLFVEEDGTLLIADYDNHRIVEWKRGDTIGRIVAGGNGKGDRDNQLNNPTDVTVDRLNNCLIISDRGNSRVVRWSRQSGTTRGEIIVSNIRCLGLTMDDERCLYVTNINKDEVRRYAGDGKIETIVAGGNDEGANLNQLNYPVYVFVDHEHSIYVSDWNNHRVMKWVQGAKEGIVVAGGQEQGDDLTQLSSPNGIIVDELGTLYVAEDGNHRVTRWRKGEKKGSIIAGGNGEGRRPDQLKRPEGLSFDIDGNLYVVDYWNHRVQRFDLEKN